MGRKQIENRRNNFIVNELKMNKNVIEMIEMNDRYAYFTDEELKMNKK